MSNIDVHNLSEKDQHLSEPPAMTAERLQELKELYKDAPYKMPNVTWRDALSHNKELIAALEAARAELAEAQDTIDSQEERLRTQKLAFEHTVADLRKQLAEAEHTGAEYIKTQHKHQKDIRDLQAEVERLRGELVAIAKAWEA